jgi:sRNA-binding regulator protein Hfq
MGIHFIIGWNFSKSSTEATLNLVKGKSIYWPSLKFLICVTLRSCEVSRNRRDCSCHEINKNKNKNRKASVSVPIYLGLRVISVCRLFSNYFYVVSLETTWRSNSVMKNTISLGMTPCSPVQIHKRFVGMFCLHLQDQSVRQISSGLAFCSSQLFCSAFSIETSWDGSMMNWKGFGRKWPGFNLYYPGIIQEGLWKTTKHFNNGVVDVLGEIRTEHLPNTSLGR